MFIRFWLRSQKDHQGIPGEFRSGERDSERLSSLVNE
jgi:hypothetical protein